MPLVIRQSNEDPSTGKYKTASERGEDRTFTNDAGGDPVGKVQAASELGDERTLTSGTEVGPRRKVEDAGPQTYTADGVVVEEVSDKKAAKAAQDGAKVIESAEVEDKAVRSSPSKRRKKA